LGDLDRVPALPGLRPSRLDLPLSAYLCALHGAFCQPAAGAAAALVGAALSGGGGGLVPDQCGVPARGPAHLGQGGRAGAADRSEILLSATSVRTGDLAAAGASAIHRRRAGARTADAGPVAADRPVSVALRRKRSAAASFALSLAVTIK